MIVHAAALHQLEQGNSGFLILRELGVAIINGLVWGGIMGIVTWLLHGDAGLGGVMMLAILLNPLLASLIGMLIWLLMIRIGHDLVVGSSVMIIAIADTGGFIFLGLTTLFLAH
ncbi:MAG: Magnesium transporter MgtE [Sodalis sp.]|nr:MAG: Magnesium transporter MgtE [Sodalis sp.]